MILAQGEGGGEGGQPGYGGSPMSMLVMMGLMFTLMYFLLIRPQRIRQKKLQEEISAMKKGDRVITAGGIHGMVENVKDKTVVLKVADNVRIEFELASVGRVIKRGEAANRGLSQGLRLGEGRSGMVWKGRLWISGGEFLDWKPL